jgi:hypothetical protein
VFDAADATLDGVPLGIEGPVESGRTASLGSLRRPYLLLVADTVYS